MRRCSRPGRAPSWRTGGFTLVELLVAVTILAILMSFTLGALFTSQEKAREARTRALIAQLHELLIERWESYRTRRLPIQMASGESVKAFAARQLAVRRQLMRMELPDRFSDITDGPDNALGTSTRPALSQAYSRQLSAASSASAQDQDAECLYLIIANSRDDENLEFLRKNSGDKDNDGLREFHDAWGRPIRWLRWPVGFLPPDCVTDFQTGDEVNDHDPFDTRKSQTEAYATMPLIYSAGPDGQYDIVGDLTDSSGNLLRYSQRNFTASGGGSYSHNPYVDDGGSPPRTIGQPADFNNDGLNHSDNIHNHLISTRLSS